MQKVDEGKVAEDKHTELRSHLGQIPQHATVRNDGLSEGREDRVVSS